MPSCRGRDLALRHRPHHRREVQHEQVVEALGRGASAEDVQQVAEVRGGDVVGAATRRVSARLRLAPRAREQVQDMQVVLHGVCVCVCELSFGGKFNDASVREYGFF